MTEAQAFVHDETVKRAGSVRPPQEVKGSLVYRTHLDEKLAPGRLHSIAVCIAGQCGLSKADGTATACLGGCGRSLHVETCAQMGKGYAALGNFTCPECRLAKLVQSPETAGDELRHTVNRTMVLELGQGKETTAAGYANYTRLEEEYVLGMGRALDERMILPRHSAEAFKNFLTWLIHTRKLAREVDSIVRSAGSYFVKLKLTDVTKLGEVKAHLKDLSTEIDMLSEPCTTATPAMLKHVLEVILPRRFRNPFLVARYQLQFLIESVVSRWADAASARW